MQIQLLESEIGSEKQNFCEKWHSQPHDNMLKSVGVIPSSKTIFNHIFPIISMIKHITVPENWV